MTRSAQSTALLSWQFSSIMSTAMTMRAAMAHLMELPGKMRYEAPLYARLHRTLYPVFGKTAGIAEGIAVISTSLLAAHLSAKRPDAFLMTATAAARLAAAHGAFWIAVAPANREIASWPLDAYLGTGSAGATAGSTRTRRAPY